ncbi:MAG: AraC family transcriptional regulator [Candidatus Woodwardiibium sp.]
MEQDFSLSELSKHIGYSPYHLSREYKKQTGRTLMDYVMPDLNGLCYGDKDNGCGKKDSRRKPRS